MNNPKEEAKRLYNQYLPLVRGGNLDMSYHEKAKQCALLAAQEVLNEFPKGVDNSFERKRFKHWIKIKKEIDSL